MNISLIGFNARYTHSCPALFYVRNELEVHLPQASVALKQFTINDPYYETLLRITAGGPGAIFFSVYIWNTSLIRRLLMDLRQVLPQTPIVLGGPEAPYVCDAMHNISVIRGEIEGVGPQFYKDLAQGKLEKEYTCQNGRPFAMPYRESDFSGPLANRHIYYESSRGCPFACSYCLSSVSRGVNNKELSEVEEELGRIMAHRPKIIRFVDRTFNGSADRSLAIWRFLLAQPGETVFHFEIAPDLFNEEMFSFLESVPLGKFQFEIGLQSTNAVTLEAVNRSMDIAKAFANIRRLMALDTIHLHLDLILGLPQETRESFRNSFNDVYDLAPHYIQMGLLKILPDTPISQAKEEFGITNCVSPPYSVLANRWLDHAAIDDLYWFGEGVESFYNNRFFRATLSYVKRVEKDPFAFFHGLIALCRKHGFFERSATQDLMARMLLQYTATREDGELFAELLRFDWLRSGHRFLPEFLGPQSMPQEKDFLWQRLPQEYPPLYTSRSRSSFFKRATFAKFSLALLQAVRLDQNNAEGYVVFSPDEVVGVHKLRKTVLLNLPDNDE